MKSHSMGRSLSSSLPLVSQSMTNTTNTINSTQSLSQCYTRCDELRVRIHENHLSYLNREETPAKLEMRTKIECLIAEYLSLVPNTHKFSFIEVSNCLNKSIEEKRDFSAYKACGAFEALEKYATNLITHPWRREYQSICPYSGFYRHVIDKHIIGAENILFLMGFIDNESKGIYQLTDTPIDPDKVSRVSLECLVAFVELQIMIQIRETLKSKGFSNISWREIHSLRVEYVCGQSDVIKLVSEMKRTAKLIDYENSNVSSFPKMLTSIDSEESLMRNGYSLIDDSLSPKRHLNDEKHLLHSYIPDTYDDEDDATESFDLMNYPILSPHSYPLNPSCPSCQYCLPHSTSLPTCPPAHLSYASPTLFSAFPTTSPIPILPKIQTFNKGIQAEFPHMQNGLENSFNKTTIQSNNCNKKLINDIDGVSKDSINCFTRKDSSQPLLNTNNDKSSKRDSFYDNLDPLLTLDTTILSEFKSNSDEIKLLDKKSPPQERCDSLEKKKLIDGKGLSKIVKSIKIHSTPAKSANVINNTINSNLTDGKPLSLGNSSVNTNQNFNSLPSMTSNGKTRTDEAKSVKQKQVLASKENTSKLLKGWSCLTCTYLNSDTKDVCEMCHRSRRSGNESMPLISGGRECSRCTLVNDKEEKFCRACDTSLADSPTYI